MQRRRCCRASRRRKHLSFEGDPPDSARPKRPGNGQAARAAPEDRHGQARYEIAASDDGARRGAGAERRDRRGGEPRRRAGQGLPDQPAPRIEPGGAAQARRERAAGARRQAAAGRRRRLAVVADDGGGLQGRPAQPGPGGAEREPAPLRQRPDQGGGGVGAQPDRRRPGRPEGRRAARALQRGAGLCRRAPRPGVRPPGEQRRRPADRDAGRDAEPLRRRRGDPHRRQPERVPARRLALDAGRRRGRARDFAPELPAGGRHAAGRPRAAAADAAGAGRRCRTRRRRRPAQPADHRRAVLRALGGLRLRPGAGGQGADR